MAKDHPWWPDCAVRFLHRLFFVNLTTEIRQQKISRFGAGDFTASGTGDIMVPLQHRECRRVGHCDY